MEHWIDVLLPLAILAGLAFGFVGGFFPQLQWAGGLLLGTIMSIWFFSVVQPFMDKNLRLQDPPFAHGVAFAFTLAVCVAVSSFIVGTLIRFLLHSSGDKGPRVFSQILGALLGAANAIFLITLIVLVVHLMFSGQVKSANTLWHNVWLGADNSQTGRGAQRLGVNVYTQLKPLMPPGTPDAFRPQEQ
jgi:uncharacterized membrane protein required for colicin V production